jgi:hypothetical protein
MLDRRGFLVGLASVIAAPAIVRATSIMPVRAIVPIGRGHILYDSAAWEQLRLEHYTIREVFPPVIEFDYRQPSGGRWTSEVWQLENWPGKRAIVPA